MLHQYIAKRPLLGSLFVCTPCIRNAAVCDLAYCLETSVCVCMCIPHAAVCSLAYPLGDLCLCEVRVRLLGFLASVHAEEVEGGLVGLGCMRVLGLLSTHLHTQTDMDSDFTGTSQGHCACHMQRFTLEERNGVFAKFRFLGFSALICTCTHTRTHTHQQSQSPHGQSQGPCAC